LFGADHVEDPDPIALPLKKDPQLWRCPQYVKRRESRARTVHLYKTGRIDATRELVDGRPDFRLLVRG
jgi:hypothetical protein